jgi:hypothetical protein
MRTCTPLAPTGVTPFPSGLSLMLALGVLLPPPRMSAGCLEASVGKMGDGERTAAAQRALGAS